MNMKKFKMKIKILYYEKYKTNYNILQNHLLYNTVYKVEGTSRDLCSLKVKLFEDHRHKHPRQFFQ